DCGGAHLGWSSCRRLLTNFRSHWRRGGSGPPLKLLPSSVVILGRADVEGPLVTSRVFELWRGSSSSSRLGMTRQRGCASYFANAAWAAASRAIGTRNGLQLT